MVAATVIIPTHSHPDPLAHTVASVQAQTLHDFELFIIGDGVTDDTRKCVANVCSADTRIRFFDFPKGPRKGEIYRHIVLKEARGRFIAYLGDDDLWFPEHLQVLDDALADADFAHTLHVGLDAQGAPFFLAADFNWPDFRQKMLTELFNRFDFSFVGHTLEAYRRLPKGWITTPSTFPWTDLYMWRQFLQQPWCCARSIMVPTGICTHTHLRPHLTNFQRANELAFWRDQFSSPNFREILWRKIAITFSSDLIRHETEVGSLKTHRALRDDEFGELEARLVKKGDRVLELEAELVEANKSLETVSAKLTDLSRSRLLSAGRLFRRLTGRPISY